MDIHHGEDKSQSLQSMERGIRSPSVVGEIKDNIINKNALRQSKFKKHDLDHRWQEIKEKSLCQILKIKCLQIFEWCIHVQHGGSSPNEQFMEEKYQTSRIIGENMSCFSNLENVDKNTPRQGPR